MTQMGSAPQPAASMSMGCALPFTRPGEIAKVRVHPVVIFSILDMYIRRPENNSYVIGTLLGNVSGDVVEIRNSFAVPHEVSDEKVLMRTDFNAQMLELNQKVYPTEQIVGWYATKDRAQVGGAGIDEDTCVIHHEFYEHECDAQPVHLVIDTSLVDGSLAIQVYTSTSLAFKGQRVISQFSQLKLEIMCSDSERVGIDVMMKSRIDGIGSSQPVGTGLKLLQDATVRLSDMLSTVCKYIEDVKSGDVEPNPEVLLLLGDVVSVVPKISAADFSKSFHDSLQDMLMVVYLSNLARTQIAVAEKLERTPYQKNRNNNTENNQQQGGYQAR